MTREIDEQLLNILACPLCKSSLEEKEERLSCTNRECGCVYPVEDGIPIALIEEADRPCPECDEQREWFPEKNMISCPHCDTSFQYEYEQET